MTCEYHQLPMTRMENFIATSENPKGRVDIMQSEMRTELYLSNREIIMRILRAIIFCGRHGLPLRGHRYDDIPSGAEITNKGVFAALKISCVYGHTYLRLSSLNTHILVCLGKNVCFMISKNHKYVIIRTFILKHTCLKVESAFHNVIHTLLCKGKHTALRIESYRYAQHCTVSNFAGTTCIGS